MRADLFLRAPGGSGSVLLAGLTPIDCPLFKLSGQSWAKSTNDREIVMSIKEYLGYEQARNKRNAALYEAMVKTAYGPQNSVLVGHHIGFEDSGQIETENEIPSADTLIFDHEIMTRVFGSLAIDIMKHLASVPCEQRDDLLLDYFNAKQAVKDAVVRASWRDATDTLSHIGVTA